MSGLSQNTGSKLAGGLSVLGIAICVMSIAPLLVKSYFIALIMIGVSLLLFGVRSKISIDIEKGKVYGFDAFFGLVLTSRKTLMDKSDVKLVEVVQYNESNTYRTRVQSASIKIVEFHVKLISEKEVLTIAKYKDYNEARTNAIRLSKAWKIDLEDPVREKLIKNALEREERLNKRRR